MEQKDYYKTLGISENATDAEIKKAFRKMARKYHPDSNKQDPNAEKKFKEVSEAYQVLKNKTKRNEYDTIRKYGSPRNFGGGQGGGFDFNDIFRGGGQRSGQRGGGGFSSMFQDLFGGGQKQADVRKKGSDISVDIEITFRKAILGGKKTLRLKATETCLTCKGTGGKKGTQAKICPNCSGTGTVNNAQGDFVITNPCPVCMGKGRIYAQPCPDCHGTGQKEQIKTINVNIPKAITENGKIRLRGQGNPGENGGKSGDLIITVHIEDDEIFTRNGKNLEMMQKLSLQDILSGTKVKITNIDDSKVLLKIPSLTQVGTRFRIPKKGVDESGDLFITISVEIPKTLSKEKIDKIIELLKTE